MSALSVPIPPQLERLQRPVLIAGTVGLLATLAGGLFSPAQFFRSYLYGFLFWNGIAIGCLSISFIHHLSGGMWGLVIQRILEAGTRNLRLGALLFLPLVFGLPHVYQWARPELVATDEALQHKAPYLNPPFFVGRAIFYFVAWVALAHFMNKWSLALDEGPNRRISRRLNSLAGGGLLLMGLTITFSSIDWAMSLDPHWMSTVYGIWFMIGQALSAMALAIVTASYLVEEKPLRDVIRPVQFHDLGKLLFAFVMLWAYISFSQFLIIWSANLPEETPWYLRRIQGGWQYLALMLVVFHFALPFLMLLSRELKRNAGALALVAAGLLTLRMVDLYWLIAPDLHGHEVHGLSVHWMDLSALVGVGGVWLAAFLGELRKRPLVPVGDPEIRELLEAARG